MNELADSFKETMACYPAGVVIVTTIDSAGLPVGFTATSFSSLSLDPPSICVCLASNAFSYEAFINCSNFVVNFVDADRADVARTFAKRGADKFIGIDIVKTKTGVPVLEDSIAFIECENGGHFVSGDHSILVGNVQSTQINKDKDVLIYSRRQFGRIGA